MRKTKIICTLGPSTDKEGVLETLIQEGMDVARFNFSHGSHREQKERLIKLQEIRERLGRPVAALLDTKGPEIRIRTFKEGKVELVEGQEFTLTSEDIEGTNEKVSVTYEDLYKDLKPGDSVLIDDGLIGLEVVSIEGNTIFLKLRQYVKQCSGNDVTELGISTSVNPSHPSKQSVPKQVTDPGIVISFNFLQN